MEEDEDEYEDEFEEDEEEEEEEDSLDEEEEEEEDGSSEGDDEEDESDDSEDNNSLSSQFQNKLSIPTNGHCNPEDNAVADSGHAIDLLLDLDFSAAGSRQIVDPECLSSSSREILNTIEGDGIELSLSFPRTNDAQYTPLNFLLRNTSDVAIEGVKLSPPPDFDVKKEFEVIDIPAGASHNLCVSVDLGDSVRRVEWNLSRKTNETGRTISIEVPIGEQVQPIRLTVEEMEKERRRMSGLNRHSAELSTPVSEDDVLTVINAYRMPDGFFTCQTRSHKDLVIIHLSEKCVEVSSDNVIFGKMIVNLVRDLSLKECRDH